MENAYLLATDIHDTYKDIESRFDYHSEVEHSINHIASLAEKYKQRGINPTLIFMGDLYNNSYKDIGRAVYSNNTIIYLKLLYESMFSLIGNHELSFYKDNPFWTLMKEIKSEKVNKIKHKSWRPLGILPVLDVVDRIEDGEVVLHFNHYNTAISQPEKGKINFGLFHQDITCKQIIDDMKITNMLDIFEKNPIRFDINNVLQGYDYAFFAHMHKIYGKWTYIDDDTKWKTILYYLASLGRPNHTEVNDNFLERNIPAIIVKDGKFVGIEDNKFNLFDRKTCVKEDVIKINQTKYAERKDLKNVISYTPIGDDPIQNIMSVFASNPDVANIFMQYTKSDVIDLERELFKKVEEIRWE